MVRTLSGHGPRGNRGPAFSTQQRDRDSHVGCDPVQRKPQVGYLSPRGKPNPSWMVGSGGVCKPDGGPQPHVNRPGPSFGMMRWGLCQEGLLKTSTKKLGLICLAQHQLSCQKSIPPPDKYAPHKGACNMGRSLRTSVFVSCGPSENSFKEIFAPSKSHCKTPSKNPSKNLLQNTLENLQLEPF